MPQVCAFCHSTSSPVITRLADAVLVLSPLAVSVNELDIVISLVFCAVAVTVALIAPDRSAPVVLVLSAEAVIDALDVSVAAPSLRCVAVAVTDALDERFASPSN